MVLVDTSVWIDHFRRANARLVSLLESAEVAVHPFVVGEIACGNISNRKEIIPLLESLPPVGRVGDEEVLLFIERHRLMGRGIGLVDAHLLASCFLDGCRLWTKDKSLAGAAKALKVGFHET